MVYFLVLAIVLGQNIDTLLKDKGGVPFETFNSVILFYFLGDLLIRCFLQPLPSIQLTPYLRFKIRHSSILTYLLYRSLWNFFNIVPLLVVVPFAIKIIHPNFGSFHSVIYLFGFFLVVLLNNYTATLINYLSRKNALYLVIPFVMAGAIMGLQSLGIPVKLWSVSFGRMLMQGNPMLFVLVIFLLTAIYLSIYKILSKNFYFDEINAKNSANSSKRFIWMDVFNQYGETGAYFSLELKLLLRNKRPRQMMVMFPLMVVYLLFIVFKDGHNRPDSVITMMFISMAMAAGSSIYGQFMFSWESIYFDGIMARKNNFVNYVKSKYYLLVSMATIVFIPLIIFFCIKHLFDPILLVSFFLFTLGPLSFIIIFFGTFNDGKIDLNQSSFFNYQGVKGNQFILTLVLMLMPLGIYSLFNYLAGDLAGKLAIIIPGILFIVYHNWWIKAIIVQRFMSRKYKNLEGYRKLSA
jgi:hypothetical protein